MRTLGKPYPASDVDEPDVVHAWAITGPSVGAHTVIAHLEDCVDTLAHHRGRVVDSPLYLEAFRPGDDGVPADVLADCPPAVPRELLVVLHGWAHTRTRNAVLGLRGSRTSPT